MMFRLVALAPLLASTDAFYTWTMAPYAYDFLVSSSDFEPRNHQPTPRWAVSPDAYELKVRLPDLEPTSVKAALGADGTKIEVTGERKIDGCTCTPSIVKEISLPYRPRAEDVDVAYDKDSVLSLKLARHAKTESATTPLSVSVTTPPKDDAEQPPTGTREIRFVPHESAKAAAAPSLEEQEKSLTEKFRTAALASVAVQHQPGGGGGGEASRDHEPSSAKEAAAATAEAAAAGATTAGAAADADGIREEAA